MDCFPFTIESLDGMCPVQGVGRILDKRWYFRARHNGWQFGVDETDDDAVEATMGGDRFCLSGDWGSTSEVAGYMPTADALELISKCVRRWALTQREIEVISGVEDD